MNSKEAQHEKACRWISTKERNPQKERYYHVLRNGGITPAVHFFYIDTENWSSDTDFWLEEIPPSKLLDGKNKSLQEFKSAEKFIEEKQLKVADYYSGYKIPYSQLISLLNEYASQFISQSHAIEGKKAESENVEQLASTFNEPFQKSHGSFGAMCWKQGYEYAKTFQSPANEGMDKVDVEEIFKRIQFHFGYGNIDAVKKILNQAIQSNELKAK